MRIDALAEVSQLYQVNGARKKTEKPASHAKDSVEISGLGKDLQVAKQAVARSEDIREEKVQKLKESMANGTYNVPLGALADKLLSGFNL